jgi:hypothetical protein
METRFKYLTEYTTGCYNTTIPLTLFNNSLDMTIRMRINRLV